jgi:ABC-type antimicrobial peptide transport system permease subunit
MILLTIAFLVIMLGYYFVHRNRHKGVNFIHKDKKIGNGWIVYFTIYLDGDFRIGFRISGSIISFELVYFSVGIWNSNTTTSYKANKK